VVRFAEEIVYPIRRPDWQIVQIENYESGEIRLAYTVYVFGRERYVPPRCFSEEVANAGLISARVKK